MLSDEARTRQLQTSCVPLRVSQDVYDAAMAGVFKDMLVKVGCRRESSGTINLNFSVELIVLHAGTALAHASPEDNLQWCDVSPTVTGTGRFRRRWRPDLWACEVVSHA